MFTVSLVNKFIYSRCGSCTIVPLSLPLGHPCTAYDVNIIVVNEFVDNSTLWLVNSFSIAKQKCVFVTQVTYFSLQKTMTLRGKVG